METKENHRTVAVGGVVADDVDERKRRHVLIGKDYVSATFGIPEISKHTKKPGEILVTET